MSLDDTFAMMKETKQNQQQSEPVTDAKEIRAYREKFNPQQIRIHEKAEKLYNSFADDGITPPEAMCIALGAAARVAFYNTKDNTPEGVAYAKKMYHALLDQMFTETAAWTFCNLEKLVEELEKNADVSSSS